LKLFERYNRLNITATIFTFIIGSCTFYFLLSYILVHQLDETLQTEQQEIISFVTTHNSLPEIIRTKDQYISYEQASNPVNLVYITIRNTQEELREIQFTVQAGDKFYLVKVDKPLEETEALLKVIIGVTIAMIALILLTGYLINRIVIRKLWRPFYQTIDKVKSYRLTDQNALILETGNIDEFSLLNSSISDMTERIQNDYNSLKNFTGQAAHEMQTPLAIISTKLDQLIQTDFVLEKNARIITEIEKAVHRLSRLHQSLLLLTRVENRQFALNEAIRLDQIIEDKWVDYSEMAEALQLHMTKDLQPVSKLFHRHLAEIVISNLLNNAIRYNIRGGDISIVLTGQQLMITNTSGLQELDNDKVFKRFYRGQSTNEGNGLGLSIIKQICDLAEYSLTYRYQESKHVFIISF